MAADPLTRISTRQTHQSKQADPLQVANSAGGFSFAVTPEDRVRRFLINGVDGGTYYISEQALTEENAAVVIDFARNRTRELVDLVVEISIAGRAPKQGPGLFALAAAAGLGDEDGRRYALDALGKVARTGTTLFSFLTYVEQFRGWGPTLRRAVGQWYTGYPTSELVAEVTRSGLEGTEEYVAESRPVAQVAHQAVKYRQRGGWTHRDVLRLSHGSKSVRKSGHSHSSNRADGTRRYLDGDPELTPDRRALFDWIAGRDVDLSAHESLRIIEGFERIRKATDKGVVAGLVTEYGLPWEALPDAFMNAPEVWEALLGRGMPIGALVRQLPRLTKLGLLSPLGQWISPVTQRLTDPEVLRKGRIHPINLLVAQRTYTRGKGKGGEWAPVQHVADALDQGFYAAFGAVVPTGKRMNLALDVSGSMSMPSFSRRHQDLWDRTSLTPREVSAAMALVTAATESQYLITGFSHRMQEIKISPRQRLDDVMRVMAGVRMGMTDCSLPMVQALEQGLEIDTFVIYTDSETYAGGIHPHQALRRYRERTGIPAKLIVIGMTSNGFTIADPNDVGMLDVVGFDLAVPHVISDFTRS